MSVLDLIRDCPTGCTMGAILRRLHTAGRADMTLKRLYGHLGSLVTHGHVVRIRDRSGIVRFHAVNEEQA